MYMYRNFGVLYFSLIPKLGGAYRVIFYQVCYDLSNNKRKADAPGTRLRVHGRLLTGLAYTTLYSTISLPSLKRPKSSDVMSSVWAAPSRISSANSKPQAGPCWKPWPLKPPMQ